MWHTLNFGKLPLEPQPTLYSCFFNRTNELNFKRTVRLHYVSSSTYLLYLHTVIQPVTTCPGLAKKSVNYDPDFFFRFGCDAWKSHCVNSLCVLAICFLTTTVLLCGFSFRCWTLPEQLLTPENGSFMSQEVCSFSSRGGKEKGIDIIMRCASLKRGLMGAL